VPVLSLPITLNGAIVDVGVGHSRSHRGRLRTAGAPIPAAVSLRALIDTGADNSSVEPDVIAQLGLPLAALGLANAPAVSGLGPVAYHEADLAVLNPAWPPLVVHDLELLELPLGIPMYQVLIGRDVLAVCDFLYEGRNGRFELRY
jgi:hypothetical protein